jgi:hypothetical protein
MLDGKLLQPSMLPVGYCERNMSVSVLYALLPRQISSKLWFFLRCAMSAPSDLQHSKMSATAAKAGAQAETVP